MNRYTELYKKIIEDVTAASVFGPAGTGSAGGQFPANSDKGYAPGDARIPSYLGAKKRKGKLKIPMQRRQVPTK